MSLRQVELHIMDSARAPMLVSLELRELSLAERVKRGAVRFGATLLVAFGCVFVPLAHFILVPLALLASPVMAYLAMRRSVIILADSVKCPKCFETTEIEAGSVGWPVSMHCSKCGTTFSARPSASLAA